MAVARPLTRPVGSFIRDRARSAAANRSPSHVAVTRPATLLEFRSTRAPAGVDKPEGVPMIDRIFSAALTFCLLIGGTLAIGSALFGYDRSTPAPTAAVVAAQAR
jgi:hypothetical protein